MDHKEKLLKKIDDLYEFRKDTLNTIKETMLSQVVPGLEWNVAQLAMHIASDDENNLSLFKMLTEKGESSFKDVSQFRREEIDPDKNESFTLEQVNTELENGYSSFITWVENTPEDTFNIEYTIQEMGTYRLDEFMDMLEDHINEHVDQLNKALGK